MRKLLIPLVAALVVVPSGSAEAQAQWDIKSFLTVCLTGSLRPCASVIVETHWNGTTTEVVLRVRNEQGTLGLPDVTGGSFLTQIGLTAPTLVGIAGFGVSTSGTVGETGSPLLHWQLEPGGIGGQVTFKAGTDTGKNGAIRGCDDPNGTTTHFFNTCNEDGNTGWVVFSFTTSEEWSASEAEIALKYQSIGDQDLSLECRTGDDGGPHACAVVPEPETYALLLTGLIGVFGMGWLRRRKEKENTLTEAC